MKFFRILVLAAFICRIGYAASAEQDQILSVASLDLINYLQKCVQQIPSPSDFNLKNSNDVYRATLGNPIAVLAIKGDADTNALTVAAITVAVKRWYVPVFIDQTIRFFIAVSNLSGENRLIRSASGFAYLAAEYGRISAAWPNHTIALITVPSTGRYFFTIKDYGLENMTPFQSPFERGALISLKNLPPPQDFKILCTVRQAMTIVQSDKKNNGVK